jgi:hypothetical protein
MKWFLSTVTAFALIGAALCLVVAGCSTAPPKQTEFMQSVEGLEITKRQLQTIMYQYAARYADGVDLAAFSIYQQAEDPVIRRNAIAWNTNSVPIMMKHCFNDEPLAALIFAWAYAIQVQDFFETGLGTDFFGPHQEIAIETSTRLEGELEDIALGLLPEPRVRAFRERLTEWTSAHPIDNSRFVSSIVSEEALEAMGAPVAGGLGAAAAMSEQMVALTDRANIMTAYLPRQIAWQTAAVTEESRELAEDIQEQAIGGLDPILVFMDEQRAAFARDVGKERAAVIQALAEERIAILASLEKERAEVFREIADERNAVLLELNNLTLAAIERLMTESRLAMGEAFVSMEGSIDGIARRTVQLLALPAAVLVVLLIVVMIWVRNTVNRMLAIWERRLDRSS